MRLVCTAVLVAATSIVDAGDLAGAGRFVGGTVFGLAAHEAGHVIADVGFGAGVGVRRVDFSGVPFFAITHDPVPRRQEFVISSAGFWVQHAGSEWILSRHPDLRHERAPFTKGVLAFNVLCSTAYATAAFGRWGPNERDTRGLAESARIGEPWIGAAVLAPAALDAYRYYRPEARWAAHTSRALKIGLVLLVLR